MNCKLILTLLTLACLALAASPAAGQCGVPNFAAATNRNAGPPSGQLLPSDLNGDGKTDFVRDHIILMGNASGMPKPNSPNFWASNVTLADFNGDGLLDIAGTRTGRFESFLILEFGDGAGRFNSPAAVAQIPRPFSYLFAADFNNDSAPDIFVGNSSGADSTVLLGNSAGGFLAQFRVAVVNSDMSTAGDFNGDGRTDLILVNGSVYLAPGDGTGHFGAVVKVATDTARFARAADVNADGRLDLVTVGQADGVSVLLGDGAGGFAAPKSFRTGFTAAGVAVGDFNGDGRADLVAAGSWKLALLTGDGAGNFTAAGVYGIPQSPLAVEVGDVNGDGRLDAVTANARPDGLTTNPDGTGADGTATVLLGDGAGGLRYASVVDGGANPLTVVNGDLNGDGKLDLVVGNVGQNSAVLLGDGAGGFGPPRSIAHGTQAFPTALGDVDGDGRLDMATANYDAGTVSVLLGDGAGGFGPPSSFAVPGTNPKYVSLADFNNDGRQDLVVAYYNSGRVSILPGDGAGGFGPAASFNTPSGGRQIAVDDFNGDGKADIAHAGITGVSVLLGDGNGGLGAASTLFPPGPIRSVVVGGFNGGGDADLAAIDSSYSALIFLNLERGWGIFASPGGYQVGVGPAALAVADYDGDGDDDLAAATDHAGVSVVYNDGGGGFYRPVEFVTPGPAARSITSGDFDSDGRPDLAVANQGGNTAPAVNPAAGNVTVLMNRCAAPPAPFPTVSVRDVTVTEGDSGSAAATFTVSLSAASSRTVSVSFYAAPQSASKDSDFAATSGRVSFAPGVTSQTVTVPVLGDTTDEEDESFLVFLAHPLNAKAAGPGRATITDDDDPPPSASINDLTLAEGSGFNAATIATFNVSLSAPSGKPVTVSYSTADGSARAGSDYMAASGTLTFEPGQTSREVNVTVAGDSAVEGDEEFFVNLTGPLNVTLADAQGRAAIIDDDSAVQFEAAAQAAAEAGGAVHLTVTRVGRFQGASTLAYSTAGGTASERSDYTPALGVLRFEPGESSKVIDVLVTDDRIAEGGEGFAVNLSDPSPGTSLGALASASVTVADDDSTTGASPVAWGPSFDPSFFVRQHYADFLGREPDADGFAFWTNDIEKCGADPGCREVKRVHVSAAFFLSIEFQQTGYLVYKTYKAAYGNIDRDSPAPVRLRDFLADTQQIARGVRVGIGDWEAQLEANKRAYFESFLARPRFFGEYPPRTTAEQYVARLNANTGFVLTDAERASLIAYLDGPGDALQKRATVLRRVAENAELDRRERNRAFVLMQYFGYLRRDPDAAPDANWDGYNFWLSKLDQFDGDFVRAEMVKAFITSIEYRDRFGGP